MDGSGETGARTAGIEEEPVSAFPKLAIAPGDYSVEWSLGDRWVPGEVELEPNRPPRIVVFGDIEERDWSRGGAFPQEDEYDHLVGRLRSGQDIVVTDVHASTWLPRRVSGSGRHAVVGLNIGEVDGNAYSRIRFQLTDLDMFFGVAPIESVSWPQHPEEPGSHTYAVQVNPAADHEWLDDADDLRVTCSYDRRFTISNAHRHEVAFAPVISIACRTPLTVDQWVDRWVMPALRVATLATRKLQRLSWMTVSTTGLDPTDEERFRSPSGVVFGGGISQSPYEAEYLDEWRLEENRPLFTLATIPMPLPALLTTWRALQSSDNPFMELYGQSLRHDDLPARARYLYLVQALEALHTYEHASEDSERDANFRQQREVALDDLSHRDLPSGALRLLRDTWPKWRMDSLDRRLRELIAQLPDGVQRRLTVPPDNTIARDFDTAGVPAMDSRLRSLRNDLSHGSRNYDDFDLRPWVAIVDSLCRAHALRLLGFASTDLERGLGAPMPPPMPQNEDLPPG